MLYLVNHRGREVPLSSVDQSAAFYYALLWYLETGNASRKKDSLSFGDGFSMLHVSFSHRYLLKLLNQSPETGASCRNRLLGVFFDCLNVKNRFGVISTYTLRSNGQNRLSKSFRASYREGITTQSAEYCNFRNRRVNDWCVDLVCFLWSVFRYSFRFFFHVDTFRWRQ